MKDSLNRLYSKPIVMSASIFLTLLVLLVLAHDFLYINMQCKVEEANFYSANNSPEEALANLFRTQGWIVSGECGERAKELFYSTLLNVNEREQTSQLLEAMSNTLDQVDEVPEASDLKDEIETLLNARALVSQEQYTAAMYEYDKVIELNNRNVVLLYERASVLIKVDKHEEALADIEQVLTIAKEANEPASNQISQQSRALIEPGSELADVFEAAPEEQYPTLKEIASTPVATATVGVTDAASATALPTQPATLTTATPTSILTTMTPTKTVIRTSTQSTQTPTSTLTVTATSTLTVTPTSTLTVTSASTLTVTATSTLTVTPTSTLTVTPTNISEPSDATLVPTDTPFEPTNTPFVPTSTPFVATNTPIASNTPFVATNTPIASNTPFVATNTPIPSNTAFVPTSTPRPSNTPFVPTSTPIPTNTPFVPTSTPIPTNTPFVPTNTPIPTNTPFVPTNTPIPTNTPFVPTNTPIPTNTPFVPTSTPVPTNTPAAYPRPVLLTPDNGVSISNNVQLQWSWNGTLQEDEHFDVRVWREGEPAYGIGWTKETSFLFYPSSKGDGNYLWSVTVIRGQNGQWQADLSDPAQPRSLNISGAPSAPATSTPPP